jgi:hypothetical protein
MNIPAFTATVPANRIERFETAIKTIEDGLANKHIWNVDFVASKSNLTSLAESALGIASQPYSDETREARRGSGGWDNADPRWMVVYEPQFSNTPGAYKKLQKYEGKNPKLDIFIQMMKEVASVALLVKEVKPFIVMGRKPSENPVEKDVTNTGHCSVCGKMHKLTFNGLLVDHGYVLNRNWGGRAGICFGAKYPAFELSPEGAIDYKAEMEMVKERKEGELVKLQGKEVPSLTKMTRVRKGFGQFEDVKTTHERGTAEYEHLLVIEVMSTEREIKWLTDDIEVFTERIAKWQKKPLQHGGAETQPRWQSRLLKGQA